MSDGKVLFNVRLTVEERDRLREKARKDGYHEMSAWFRHIINADDEPQYRKARQTTDGKQQLANIIRRNGIHEQVSG